MPMPDNKEGQPPFNAMVVLLLVRVKDLNPYVIRHQILSLARLPFRHTRLPIVICGLTRYLLYHESGDYARILPVPGSCFCFDSVSPARSVPVTGSARLPVLFHTDSLQGHWAAAGLLYRAVCLRRRFLCHWQYGIWRPSV